MQIVFTVNARIYLMYEFFWIGPCSVAAWERMNVAGDRDEMPLRDASDAKN
jgi:hypothetical protein